MRLLFVSLAALVISASPAAAQYGGYKPYQPYQPTVPAAPRTTYDPYSGNRYTTTPQYDGSTTIRGNNSQTGSTWRTQVQPNGDMRGTDAQGNTWRYNSTSGSYMSTDGTTCYGKGYARSCTK